MFYISLKLAGHVMNGAVLYKPLAQNVVAMLRSE
jgi:hypothetical protein